MRPPSFVVSTEIVFGGPGEHLVIRHDTGLSPEPYVDGTLLAIRRVADMPGVRRGLDTLLFGSPRAPIEPLTWPQAAPLTSDDRVDWVAGLERVGAAIGPTGHAHQLARRSAQVRCRDRQ